MMSSKEAQDICPSRANVSSTGRKMIPVSRHWMECTEPDGVTRYYYNISTGESSWTEPEEVRMAVRSLEQLTEMGEQERKRAKSNDQHGWVERVDGQGRVYYYNTVTRATVWDRPAEIANLDGDDGERREREFVNMLKECNVKASWSWDECLKVIYSHPSYKCLMSLNERKACFEKYVCSLKSKADGREEYLDLLKSIKLVKGTKYVDIEDRLRRHECFHLLPSKDRRDMFDRHMRQVQEETDRMERQKLLHFIQSQQFLFGKHSWFDVKPLLLDQCHDPVICLQAWKEHVLSMERHEVAAAQKSAFDDHLKEYTNRFQFRALMKRLVEEDRVINHSTTFEEFLRIVDNRDEYKALLLNKSFSDPLDYFLDALDSLQKSHESSRAHKERRNSSVDERYSERKRVDDRKCVDDRSNERKCIEEKGEEIIDERKIIEQQQKVYEDENIEGQSSRDTFRPQIDKYKHFLKHFQPPIMIESKWEDTCANLSKHSEYRALPLPIAREYFEKYQLYLKRKMQK